MKKTVLLFVLIINSVVAQNQFEAVTNFQKKLIQTETTGSNVAMIFKDGKIIYHHIENSLNPKGKIFMRIQFSNMVNVKTYYNCCDDDSQRERSHQFYG